MGLRLRQSASGPYVDALVSAADVDSAAPMPTYLGSTVAAAIAYIALGAYPTPERYLPEGTDPDTVTDWSPFVQQCVAAGGSFTYRPNYRYVFETTVTLEDNVTMIVPGGCTLQASDTFDGTTNMFTIAGEDINVLGPGTIDGNKRFDGGSLTGHVFAANGIVSGDTTRIDGIKFLDWARASTTSACAAVKLTGLTTSFTFVNNRLIQNALSVGAGAVGLALFSSGNTQITIQKNVIKGAGLKDGMFLDGSLDGLQYLGNQTYNCFTGLTIGYSSAGTRFKALVQASLFFNCDGAGISCNSTGAANNGLLIQGNYFWYCGGSFAGIKVGALNLFSSCDIIGNEFYKSGYNIDGTARPYLLAAIYTPSTLVNFDGHIADNHIYDVAWGTTYGGLNTHGFGIWLQVAGKQSIHDNDIELASFGIETDAGTGLPAGYRLSIQSNNIDQSGLTGAINGIQLGVTGSTRSKNVKCLNNDIVGHGGASVYSAISIAAGCLGDGLQMNGNSVRGYSTKACVIGAQNTAYLFGNADISDNTWTDVPVGVSVAIDAVASPWILIGPNTCVNVTTRVEGTGVSSTQIRECVSKPTAARKTIVSTTLPTLATDGNFLVGDQLIGGPAPRYCTTAGNGATAVWGTVTVT